MVEIKTTFYRTIRCWTKRAFRVKLIGEGVDDNGGPYREVFIQTCNELQQLDILPFLIPSPNQRSKFGNNQEKYIVNPSQNTPQALEMYKFIGRMMGISVRCQISFPINFPSIIWKLIVGEEPDKLDIEPIDARLAKFLSETLQKSKDEWVDSDELTWSLISNSERCDLIPKGSEILVTWDKREEYVEKVIQYKLKEGREQINAIKEGIGNIIPLEILQLFNWNEIELIFCGYPHLDINKLKENTIYEGVIPTDQQIVFFLGSYGKIGS